MLQFTKEQYLKLKPEDLSIAYVTWNKQQEKYIVIDNHEEKGLEIIKMEKNTENLNFLAQLMQKWRNFEEIKLIDNNKDYYSICEAIEHKVKIKLPFQKGYEYIIYGKNPKMSIEKQQYNNIYGIGIYKLHKTLAELVLNLAYPESQIKREKRKNNIIGRVGTNVRNFMIQNIFKEKYDAIITNPISKKAIAELEKLGFIKLTPAIRKKMDEIFQI